MSLDRLAYTGACKPMPRRHPLALRALIVMAALATLGVVVAALRGFL